MSSDNIQGGFGLQLKLNGTAIVNMVELDQLRFVKFLQEISGHDGAGGYYDAQPTGRRSLEPFNCTLVWDRTEATHAAVVAAFTSNSASSFAWSDPLAVETIIFNAYIGAIGRISLQEDAYFASVQIMPTGAPAIKPNYITKILDTSPVAYYPLRETGGSSAEQVAGGSIPDGAYIGTVLADALGPDGINNAPRFDGASDQVDLYSTAFQTMWVQAVSDIGSMMIWAKVIDQAYWDSAAFGYMVYIANTNATVAVHRICKGYTATVMQWFREWTHIENEQKLPMTELGWLCAGMTWDQPANEHKAFYNGVQFGSTNIGLNAFPADALDSDSVGLGGRSSGGADVFDGWLAHFVIWEKVLTPAEMLTVATV